MNIRATELFPFAQYGGSYTGGYHQADWEKDKWLTKEAENFPLQYEVTTQKVIVESLSPLINAYVNGTIAPIELIGETTPIRPVDKPA